LFYLRSNNLSILGLSVIPRQRALTIASITIVKFLEMTYTVSSGTLNSSIPYQTLEKFLDPDYHQNLIDWSLDYVQVFSQIL